jgi:multisubunit Na+/H+ antiporter MnhC subunit
MLISYRLGRKIVGAMLGAVAVATVLSLVGYSDEGATASDYVRELTLALASYLPAALIVHWLIRRDSSILDITSTHAE